MHIQNLAATILLSLEVNGELVPHLPGGDAQGQPVHLYLVGIIHQKLVSGLGGPVSKLLPHKAGDTFKGTVGAVHLDKRLSKMPPSAPNLSLRPSARPLHSLSGFSKSRTWFQVLHAGLQPKHNQYPPLSLGFTREALALSSCKLPKRVAMSSEVEVFALETGKKKN